MPFNYLNANALIVIILVIFAILRHNLASNGLIFVKLILSIYGYGVIMHMKFCQERSYYNLLSYCILLT